MHPTITKHRPHEPKAKNLTVRFNIKIFGRMLRDWSLSIGVMLALFVFFGSHR